MAGSGQAVRPRLLARASSPPTSSSPSPSRRADATAHIVENPSSSATTCTGTRSASPWALVGPAGSGSSLKGFKEAINLAVCLVAAYLALNAVVVGYGLRRGRDPPQPLRRPGRPRCSPSTPEPAGKMLGVSLLVFPKLALGLSGFETGVAVMPLVRGGGRTPRIGSRGPDPEYSVLPPTCGADHERLPHRQQPRHDPPDPARAIPPGERRPSWRARRTGGPPGLPGRTGSSARRSAPPMTCRRSRFSGSPGPRPWPAC